MSRKYFVSHQKSAWFVGITVLLAATLAIIWMLFGANRHQRNRALVDGLYVQQADDRLDPLPKLIVEAPEAASSADAIVRGEVLLPDGVPATGATVILSRLITGWPEWQRERVDQAVTRSDGVFQFRCSRHYGYLIAFEHDAYAGDEVEVSDRDDVMRLRLKPGFEISGTVLNDVGSPMPNTRVSVESIVGQRRRAQVTTTLSDGSYRFTNLAAGPAELVARHQFWQPAKATALVIGDRLRTDFRFERPSISPLRGRVVCASTQDPVVGAVVQLVPVQQQLGLVDAVTTTTAADGSFLISGLSRGNVRMWVRHPEYGNSIATQSIRSVSNNVLVELPKRSAVAGQLDGEFVGGEVLQIQDDGGELAFATVGQDGNFACSQTLSPGVVTIRALGGALLFRNLKGTSATVRLDEPDQGETQELYFGTLLPPVVVGRFLAADGKPVAGVRMQSLSDSLNLIGAAVSEMSITKAGDSIMQLMDDRDRPLAVSDQSGRFKISGLRNGAALVEVSCAGFGSRWLRFDVPGPGQTTDVGDIDLRPGCSVTGRVLRGGEPFVGATVVLKSDVSLSMVVTDASGQYSAPDLSPGEYKVQAKIPGRPTGINNEQRVTVAPNVSGRRVDIVLDAGRIVSGVVTDDSQQPLESVLISLRGRQGEVITTNQAGEFELELPDRNVELVVSFGDRSDTKIVPVSKDQETLSITLPSRVTGVLVGRCAGLPGRRPLSGVLLRLTGRNGDQQETTKSLWVATTDGQLRQPHVPTGRIVVEIWCEGYAPYKKTIMLKPDEEHDLGDVLLATGASLRGVVRDTDGNPLRDAMVLVGEETDFDLFVPSIRSSSDGSFVIQGVTSRSSHLVVRHTGHATASVDVLLPRDVLSADPLTVMMERGTTIEVVVSADLMPDDGVVFLRRDGQLLGSTLLDDNGTGWFANRSVGAYTVHLFGGQAPPRAVQVKPGEELSRVQFDVTRK